MMIVSRKLIHSKIYLFFFSAAILFFLFAIIGAVHRYSPAPFSDMWEGYIGWYLQENKWQLLWAQHNEHRIVLARLIYWLDVVLFGNSAWFLIVVNYLLVFFSCCLFGLILKEQANKPEHDYPRKIIFLFLIAWLFSWTQEENLIWGFQNQFINAQLLPLCAFYFLYRASVDSSRSIRYFFCSCVFGILSYGTMANGVLALPLMTCYAMITRQSWQRIFILFDLSCFLLFFYFYDFHVPGQHSSLIQSLINTPFLVAQYSLLYLGGPFCKIFRNINFEHLKIILIFSGLFLFISASYFSFKYLFFNNKKSEKNSNLQLMLLFFIFFIIITAVGTAGGRIILGLETALASRYATPAIMAWAALLILYFPSISSGYKKYGNKIWLPFMIILLAMLPYEWHALRDKSDLNFQKQVALLAVELRARDDERINEVRLERNRIFAVAELAEKKNFVISGMEKLQGLRAKMGQPSTVTVKTTAEYCLPQMDSVISLPNDPYFLRVNGRMILTKSCKIPKFIQILDSGNIIGYALVDHQAGFEGYVWKKFQ
jgi:hypothetical protein